MKRTATVAVLVLVLIGVISVLVWVKKADSIPAPSGVRVPDADSVIPGGISSKEQVVPSLLDPVIRQHYADVDISKLVPEILDHDIEAMVSYRHGGKIYWMRTTIKKGELVWTDGVHLIRGRCGNLIRLDEPPPEVTELPPSLFSLTPPATFEEPPVIPFTDTPNVVLPPPPFPPTPPTVVPPTTTEYPPTTPPEYWPPVYCCVGPPVTPPPPHTPPVPEPGTIVLLGSGLASLVYLKRRR